MTHIAIIPDGNRRYMKKQGIINLKSSYHSGIERFYDFIKWSQELKVREITIYALSLENIEKRGKKEINLLLALFTTELLKKREELIHGNIEVKFCGDLEKVAELNKAAFIEMNSLEHDTKNNYGLKINIAVAYGGRQEIVNMMAQFKKHPFEVSEASIKNFLWVKSYPDIIIRTAETRISNFLLWQGAYSEIYFVDKLWQEFERTDLENIIEDYNEKERRYGK